MPRTVDNATRVRESTRLKYIRDALNFSQRELAAHFNVSASAVSQWEDGTHAIPGPVLKLIDVYAQELDATPAEHFAPSGIEKAAAWALFILFQGMRDQPAFRGLRRAALIKHISFMAKQRGLTMKLAQMASYMGFVLDKGEQTAIAAMQSAAKPMPSNKVCEIFLRELGKTPMQIFASWNKTPVAVTSLGQVHRATLRDGTDVAVKVQQWGIGEALDRELVHADLTRRALAMLMRSDPFSEVMKQVSESMREECDYRIEAAHIDTFTRHFRKRPDMQFPQVIANASSPRVLTTTWMQGQSIASLESTRGERDRWGQTIWDFHHTSVLKHGMLHTDPQPNNVVLTVDGVGFLDFGRVQRLSPQFLSAWKTMMRSCLERDPSTFRQTAVAMGGILDTQNFDFDFAWRAAYTFYQPWLQDTPFTFSAGYVRRLWNLFSSGSLGAVRYTRDMAFLNQLYFGVSALLATLGATVVCRPTMLALLYEGSSPPPFSDGEMRLLALMS